MRGVRNQKSSKKLKKLPAIERAGGLLSIAFQAALKATPDGDDHFPERLQQTLAVSILASLTDLHDKVEAMQRTLERNHK